VLAAGARHCELISEPMAAALGAGLEVTHPRGRMVIDAGGGTTDIAVLSMGQEVVATSIRVGSTDFDSAIARHLERTHQLVVGPRTAEQLKIQVGAARPTSEVRALEVSGYHRPSGLPKRLQVTSDELFPALDEPIQAILDGIRWVLERTPAEMAADIYEDGSLLTGCGALLRDFPQRVDAAGCGGGDLREVDAPAGRRGPHARRPRTGGRRAGRTQPAGRGSLDVRRPGDVCGPGVGPPQGQGAPLPLCGRGGHDPGVRPA